MNKSQFILIFTTILNACGSNTPTSCTQKIQIESIVEDNTHFISIYSANYSQECYQFLSENTGKAVIKSELTKEEIILPSEHKNYQLEHKTFKYGNENPLESITLEIRLQ